MTRDLAAANYRKNTYDFAKCIYVVGMEQSNHFKQLKAVLKELNLPWAETIVHIPFGLITLNGKKLSTRKGKIILLEGVLKEATELALKQIEAKKPITRKQRSSGTRCWGGCGYFPRLEERPYKQLRLCA